MIVFIQELVQKNKPNIRIDKDISTIHNYLSKYSFTKEQHFGFESAA